MNGFSADWLRLREAFDAQARDAAGPRTLARQLGQHLAKVRPPVRIMDLGGGTGSNMRALGPHLPAPQVWTVVDNDAGLLTQAVQQHRSWSSERLDSDQSIGQDAVQLVVREHDINDLAGLALGNFDGVTSAALLDLVSAQWLDRLVSAIAAHRLPVLFALSVDGRLTWQPEDPDDGLVGALFNRDLRRDKGFGPALGTTAAACVQALLQRHGYDVRTADSAWQIGPGDGAMLEHMLTTLTQVALQQAPEMGDRVSAWAERRQSHKSRRALRLCVGHQDVLALN